MSSAALQACMRSEIERAATVFVLDEELGAHHGLSWADFVLLHALGTDRNGWPQPQLASRLGLRGSSLLMRMRPLEKLGLLSRSAQTGQPLVALRPAGHRVLREASETAAAICAAMAGRATA